MNKKRSAGADRAFLTKGRLVLLLCAVLALIAQVVVVPTFFSAPHAQAEQRNDKVKIDLSLANSDAAGNEQDAGLRLGTHLAKMKFSYDASNAEVVAGDYFDIQMPAEFSVNGARNFQPLDILVAVPGEADKRKIGECTATEKVFKCVFNDEPQKLRDRGFYALKGRGYALLKIDADNTANQVNFGINGTDTAVTLPGNKPIAPALAKKHEPNTKFSKVVSPFNSAATGLVWSIKFNTAELETELNARGAGANFDGKTDQTVVIYDTIGAGLRYEDAGKHVLHFISSTDDVPATSLLLVQADGTNNTKEATVDGHGRFRIQTEKVGDQLKVTLTGPFRKDAVYTVSVPTKFEAGRPKEGVKYFNSARVDGTGLAANFGRAQSLTGGITAETKPGYQQVFVNKEIGGNAVGNIPDGQKFTARVAFEFPRGMNADNYPLPDVEGMESFTAMYPQAVYTDNKTRGHIDIEIEAGKQSEPVFLPYNSKVTITEPTQPNIQGVVWGEPSFGRGPEYSTTVTNNSAVTATVTNFANTQTAPLNAKKVVVHTDDSWKAGKEFTVSYVCSDGVAGTKKLPGDGTTVKLADVAVGAMCTVTENANVPTPQGFYAVLPQAQTVTIAAGDNAVDIRNEYKPFTTIKVTKKAVDNAGQQLFDGQKFAVSVTCNGQKRTLEVPANNADGITITDLREGESCTVTEDIDSSERAPYTLNAVIPGAFTVPAATEATKEVEVRNEYTLPTGGFTIKKVVEGKPQNAPNTFPTTFEVSATCDGVIKTGTVSEGQDFVVDGIPQGTLCNLSESVPANNEWNTDTSKFAGYEFSVPGNKVVVISAAAENVVTLTNKWTGKTGKIKVHKVVQPATVEDSLKQFNYRVRYTCGATSGEVDVNPATSSQEIDVPVGECTFEEINGDAVVAATAGTTHLFDKNTGIAYRNKADQSTNFRVEEGQTLEVEVANTFTKREAKLILSKTLSGNDSAKGAGLTYPFVYKCADGVEHPVEVTEGTPVEIAGLTAGEQCKVWEDRAKVDQLAPLAGYTVTPEFADEAGAKVITLVEGNNPVAIGNEITQNKGSLRIIKRVEGDYQPKADEKFTITYQCGAQPENTVEVPVGDEGAVIDNIPAGSECTVTETAEAQNRPGFTATPVAEQRVTIPLAGGDADDVTVTNTYKATKATLNLSKVVAGSVVDALHDQQQGDRDFTLTVTCTPEAGGTFEKEVTLNRKSAPKSIEVPTGTCTVAEQVDNASIAGVNPVVTHQIDAEQPQDGATARDIVVAENTAKAVVFTNTYTRDLTQIQIKKDVVFDPTVAGSQQVLESVAANHDFRFTWTCNDPIAGEKTGEVTVKGDGNPTAIGSFTVGTDCQIEEDAATINLKGYEHTTTDSNRVADTYAFTNTYLKAIADFKVAKVVKAGPGATTAELPKNFGATVRCEVEGTTLPEQPIGIRAGAESPVAGIPVGSVCQVIENPAEWPGFTLTVDSVEEITLKADEENKVTITNTYTPKMASLEVSKVVDGNMIDRLVGEDPREKEFTFRVDCVRESGLAFSPFELRVLPKTPTTVSVPTGQCTVTEVDPSQIAGVDAVVSSVFTRGDVASPKVDGVASQEFTVGDKETLGVTFTNTYNKDVAEVAVKKNIVLDAVNGGTQADLEKAAEGKKFNFNYRCEDAVAGVKEGTVAVAAGQTVSLGTVSVGTSCAISEDADPSKTEVPGFEFISVTPAQTVVVDGAKTVEFSNTYKWAVADVVVKKTVNVKPETAQPSVPTAFKAQLVCTHNGAEFSRDLMVPAGDAGQTVAGIPLGARCHVVEDMEAAKVNGMSLAHKAGAEIVVGTGANEIGLENNYTVLEGSVVVSKSVIGNAAALAPEAFTVNYQCTPVVNSPLGDGFAPTTGTLTLSKDNNYQQSIERLPEGECTFTEDVAAAQAQFAVLEATSTPADGVVRISAAPSATAEVALVNKYSTEFATFQVAKKLAGEVPADAAQQKFEFKLRCTDPIAGEVTETLLVPGDGTPVATAKSYAKGARCEVTENLDSAQFAGYTLGEVAPAVLDDAARSITLTNSYTRDVAPLAVVKTVTGEQKWASQSFDFTYTCRDGHNNVVAEGRVPVPGDGTETILNAAVPTGVKCTVAEDEAKAKRDGYSLKAEAPKTVEVAVKDSKVVVHFENKYTNLIPLLGVLALIPIGAGIIALLPKLPVNAQPQPPAEGVRVAPATPPAPPAPPAAKGIAKGQAKDQPQPESAKPQLAQTGANVIWLLVVALLLVGAGAFLMRRRNR
ncbi:MAG: DUF5979 domain-containing protein [Corynebacterium sp.]|uniref:DUF5979 domain-containing protein n=1 Tax=Corynebacterium sp. TaxID=1720 RepID=UPI0026DC2691|nr:DUF5979 domain-containing protein [Corynebacterium sp.]MDO4760638.1 DUF5979 domain-containing protein [Corynebacterium sp.]